MGRTARIGGNERTHLREDHQQRGLAEIGGFAAHVGAGDDGDEFGFGVEIEIVGDEALGVLFGEFFDDGMAAAATTRISPDSSKRGRA